MLLYLILKRLSLWISEWRWSAGICSALDHKNTYSVHVLPARNMAGRRTVFATFFTTFIARVPPNLRRMRRNTCCAMTDGEAVSVGCVFESPVGRLHVRSTSEGVYSLSWLKEGQQVKEERGDCVLGRQHLATCTRWLTAYFNGSLLEFPVPRPPLVIPKKGNNYTGTKVENNFYLPSGTFSHSVWLALCGTEVGDTLSYGQLASLAGSPAAARAVGQAMRSHCIPLLIPCHRVVKSGGGGLGNYSGGDGVPTKQWLLEHERRMSAAWTVKQYAI